MSPQEELEIVIDFENETREKFPEKFEELEEVLSMECLDIYMLVS